LRGEPRRQEAKTVQEMGTSEHDARDVLDQYVGTLNQSGEGIIRDATDLAYPKDIIKFVLRHCIKTIEEADKRSFLRNAYLSLGNFQVLSDEERKAVAALNALGPPGPPGSELLEEQAKRIGDFAIPLQAVMHRLKAEVAVLAQELKLLPGSD
jgi:hypothetical protein